MVGINYLDCTYYIDVSLIQAIQSDCSNLNEYFRKCVSLKK